MALRARVRELEAMVEHLADANVRAATLVAELEEARAVEEALRRRAEEMALQRAVDRTIAGSRYLGELAVSLCDVLVANAALECRGVGVYLDTERSRRRLGAAGEPPEVEACAALLTEEARSHWDAGIAAIALRAQGAKIGHLCLATPRRAEWPDRWMQVLHSLGDQLGNAFDRLRIEARERELMIELADARDRAIAATEAKDRFLATMSHELRTPLNAIIGYAELLQEESDESGHHDALQDLRRISSSGKHLLALINDVLDLSKIEAGKIEIERRSFDLTRLLTEVAEIVHPLVARNNNELWVEFADTLGAMRGDPAKVRQILLNLLSNACKFTERGVVSLTASVARGDELVILEVRDTGIGMSEDEVARVFEPFVQADMSTSRRFGGTGLGLTISATYAALMGGSIRVRSTPGEGTAFTLTLPREQG
ncbi:MAG: ATP-binding protein [Nannocystaceae bacterium]